MGGVAAKRRYEAGELTFESVLRAGFQEGHKGGSQAGLECVQKGFSSRAYSAVPLPEINGSENLTDRLTPDLTERLTDGLTPDLTKPVSERVSEFRVAACQPIPESSPLTCRTSLGPRTLHTRCSCRGTETAE